MRCLWRKDLYLKRLCHLILTMRIIDFCLKYCISTMSAAFAIISRSTVSALYEA